MTKKTKIVVCVLTAAVVVLAIALVVTMNRNHGSPPSGSQSAEPPPQTTDRPQSEPAPETETSIQIQPDADAIPYVGPIESPIIGKWEKHPDWIDTYGMYYEFFPDGTLTTTQFYIEDKDYPESWWYKSYNFSFDTWRGQEVLESGFFMGYMHHRIEFYELDGREAMDIITIMDDGEEYVSLTLLRMED